MKGPGEDIQGEIVSTAWFHGEGKVFWPDYKSKLQYQRILKSHCAPYDDRENLDWSLFNCTVLSSPQDKLSYASKILDDSDWRPPTNQEPLPKKRATRGNPPARNAAFYNGARGSKGRNRAQPSRLQQQKTRSNVESSTDGSSDGAGEEAPETDDEPMIVEGGESLLSKRVTGCGASDEGLCSERNHNDNNLHDEERDEQTHDEPKSDDSSLHGDEQEIGPIDNVTPGSIQVPQREKCCGHCKEILSKLEKIAENQQEIIKRCGGNLTGKVDDCDDLYCLLPHKTLKEVQHVNDKLSLTKNCKELEKKFRFLHKHDLKLYVYSLCKKAFTLEVAAKFNQKGSVDKETGKVIKYGYTNLRIIKCIQEAVLFKSPRNLTNPRANEGDINKYISNYFKWAPGNSRKAKSPLPQSNSAVASNSRDRLHSMETSNSAVDCSLPPAAAPSRGQENAQSSSTGPAVLFHQHAPSRAPYWMNFPPVGPQNYGNGYFGPYWQPNSQPHYHRGYQGQTHNQHHNFRQQYPGQTEESEPFLPNGSPRFSPYSESSPQQRGGRNRTPRSSRQYRSPVLVSITPQRMNTISSSESVRRRVQFQS